MVGLLDIAPLTKSIEVNTEEGPQRIAVHGISVRGVAVLLEQFPEFKAAFTGGALDAQSLMQSAPDLVAAIIAAGTGSPGDKDAEAIADTLPLEIQLDLLEAIIDVTMPKGPGPFVKRLTGLLNSVGSEIATPSQTSNAPSIIKARQSRGKETSTTSPRASNDSLPLDTVKETSGS